MNVSFLPSALQPDKFSLIKIDGVLSSIKNGNHAAQISALPDSTLYPDRYKQAKLKLPTWAFNGAFSDKVDNAHFVESSGFFHFDIDGLINGMVAKTKQNLIDNCPHLYAIWKSPSGNGLKGLIRIPDDLIHNDADFKKAYSQIEPYFLGLGITIDKSCKDVRRLCFVCSDPDIYINTDAPAFMLDMTDKPKPAQQSQAYTTNDIAQKYINRCCNIITNSQKGDYHAARLRAGKLAGGYIAANFINEYEAIAALERASRMVSAMCGDNEAVALREIKATMDGINEGKLSPVEGDKPRAQRQSIEYIEPEQVEPEVFEAQEWQSDLSADIDFMIPAHFGIAADIQRWILDTSVKRQPAIALAATLSILSVVVGRQINFNGIKGNIMSVCLAGSGHGKDHPLKCAEIILDKVGLGDNVYAQVASGAALFEAVHTTPSCLLQIDEMGHYLSSINSKGANPFLKEVMPMITRFYTDASTHFTDKGRKAESKGKKIEEPNLSLIGMTTENQIIETMRTSEVSDGSLARFLIMYGEKGTQIQTTRLSVRDVPDSIIDGLTALMDKHGRDNFGFMGSKAIEVSESYQNAFNELSVRMNDKANELGADENSSNAMFEPFYHRVAVRSAQIALVIDQCQNIEVLKWAELLTVKTTEMFTKKFKHLAADNENEKMAKTVERAIVESGKNGITKSQLYDRTRKVSTIQKKMILDDLIESGKVFTDSRTEKGKQRAVTFYFWKAKKR